MITEYKTLKNVYPFPSPLNGIKENDTIYKCDIANLTISSPYFQKYFDNSMSAWCISANNQTSAAVSIEIPVDFSYYVGYVLRTECTYKIITGSRPLAIYPKYVSNSVTKFNAGYINSIGTSAYKTFRNGGSEEVSPNPTNMMIVVDVSSGSGLISNITIKIDKLKLLEPLKPFDNSTNIQGGIFYGGNASNHETLSIPTKDMYNELKRNYGLNLVRWGIVKFYDDAVPHSETNKTQYQAWLEYKLLQLDKVLAWCRQNNIKVLIDMHSPFGGTHADGGLNLFYDEDARQFNIDMWKIIAARYKGNKAVWAYGLINEPRENISTEATLVLDRYSVTPLAYQETLAFNILQVDSEANFSITSSLYSDPLAFKNMKPISVNGCIYEVHNYFTANFTSSPTSAHAYPGYTDPSLNIVVNKQSIKDYLKPVRDFQLAYNVPIFVGEFGSVRWANGSHNWIRDNIEIFEEYGWSWAYFDLVGPNNEFNPEFAPGLMPQGYNESTQKAAIRPTNNELYIISACSASFVPYTSADMIPTTPSNILTTQYSSIKTTVSWQEPGQPVENYIVAYKPTSNIEWIQQTTSADNLKISTSANVTYEYSVGFSNAYGSVESVPVSATSQVITPVNFVLSACSRAYGLRLLNSNYDGPIVKIRRSSDNNEIQLSANSVGVLENSEILNFVGAGNGFVSIWYDQSGNGRHLSQSATANQAYIVSAGVLTLMNNIPMCKFVGAQFYSDNNASMYASSGAIINSVLKCSTSADSKVVVSEGNTSGSAQARYLVVMKGSSDYSKNNHYIVSDANETLIWSGFTNGDSAYTTSGNIITTKDTGSSLQTIINSRYTTSVSRSYSRTNKILSLNTFCIGAWMRNVASMHITADISEVIIWNNLADTNQIKNFEKNQLETFGLDN